MNDLQLFNDKFQNIADAMMDSVAEQLFEQEVTNPSREQILAQLLMIEFFAHDLDPEKGVTDPIGVLTTEQKAFLVRIAGHMGPDYAQALYHAAVFVTKVA